MKKIEQARVTPNDVTRRGITRNGDEDGDPSDSQEVREADLALSRGGNVAAPSNGGANGTDHW
jgi:hypothetical protein